MKGLAALAARWREKDAPFLREHGDEQGAIICSLHAVQLEEALHEHESELLSIAEASEESGYSRSFLYHAVRDTLSNAGEPGRPRIRRCDLPRKPRGSEGLIPLERAAILADLDTT